ncbi:MAG: YkvA family protein [Desulfatibacillaceae bacterium]
MDEKDRDIDVTIDRDFVARGARGISEEDVRRAYERAGDIRRKFESGGPLSRFLDDAKLALSVVRDYWRGEYRRIPWWALSALVFALLYVVNPFDLIPDAIPGIGLLDDALVMGIALRMVQEELARYREWRAARDAGPEGADAPGWPE